MTVLEFPRTPSLVLRAHLSSGWTCPSASAAQKLLAASSFTKRYWSREKRWLLGLFTKRYWSREKRWLLGLITKRYWSRMSWSLAVRFLGGAAQFLHAQIPLEFGCSCPVPHLWLVTVLTVPRAPEKEDPNARELLRCVDSAGPVSPTCFDV